LFLGILTIFISGLGANFEIDLKKIIAFSTLSQLGLIISILRIGFLNLAFFHLLTHALFKALLFLCAGSFIHNLLNFQDIRLSGRLINQIPLSSICFNVSRIALCGIPFLTGFYSKDLILEIVLLDKLNIFIFFLFFFSTLLTVSYSFRLIFNISIIDFNRFSLINLSDNRWAILNSILILTFISIFGGRIIRWLIFPFFYLIILPFYLKILVLFICFFGFLLGYFFFIFFKFYNILFLKKLIFIKIFIYLI
jgi:NADH-ubiquinone oxidoreductase chain 5